LLALLVQQGLPVGTDLGHAGLPEVFLRQDVDRQLGPFLGNIDVVQLKDRGAIGVLDL
jgi:hypothetical protein